MPTLNLIGHTVLDICLLRRGPQDLPYSTTLLVIAVALSGLLGYPTMRALPPGTPTPGLDLILAMAFGAGYLYLVLRFHGLATRFVQSATALFATDCVISGLSLPLLELGGTESQATMLGLTGLIIWNLVIIAHILRNALDASLGVGFAWALGYVMSSGLIMQAMHA